MARVDFYILPEDLGVERFACKLADQIWEKHPIYVHTEDESAANVFDDLLWTFSDTSFVPHATLDAIENDPELEAAVIIGYADKSSSKAEVLFNLSSMIPDFATEYERIVEVVGGDEARKQAARLRYKQYKERGHEVQNRDLRK